MARKRGKKTEQTRQDSDEEGDILSAAATPATANALSHRARAIVVQGALCALGVFVCDYLLIHKFSDGHLGGQLIVVILTVLFIGFLSRFLAWIGYSHMRRILHGNAWDEWFVRGVAFEWLGRDLVRAVVLAHPEWRSEEIRTLHPRRYAPDFSDTPALTLWVAGNPKRTLVVSKPGGASPVRALKVRLPGLRRAIKARVQEAEPK